MTNKDVPDEVKIAYDENGTSYMIEAFGSEAEHINRLLSAERDNRLIELSQNTNLKEFIKKVNVACLILNIPTAESIDDVAEHINDYIESGRHRGGVQ